MNLSNQHNDTNRDPVILEFSKKNERDILKFFLLKHLNQLFFELFQNQIKFDPIDHIMEYYIMDGRIIQLLIQGIVETGEYTLEGISYYTRIPFDVIYDAACGIHNQFSITPWTKIVELYMQLKPEIAKLLIDKLLEIKNKNYNEFSFLLRQS